jgi:ribonuclease P protein component
VRKFKFSKKQRILKKREFKKLLTSNNYVSNFFYVDFRKGFASNPKLGITASARFGKSIYRNKFKRRVREIFRQSYHIIPNDLELNVIARKAAKAVSFATLKKELITLFIHTQND